MRKGKLFLFQTKAELMAKNADGAEGFGTNFILLKMKSSSAGKALKG
ncbi:MAG: hypothetical protein IKR48_08830 [Kiritimatiellae bacterium]|nr:hypothetical protein [Kiritimatiellia bacterium]